MLSPLQERVASIVARLPSAEGFALGGGAALILLGQVQRDTRDLDFFGLTPDDVDRLAPAAISALQESGLTVEIIQQSPGFVRLVVEGDGAWTEIDLAADARLFPVIAGGVVPTLSPLELAVDKVLAVFGRAEARDFLDLAAVEIGYGLGSLCALAAEKDRGFSPQVLEEMIGRFGRLTREEFEVDDSSYRQLELRVHVWRHQLLEMMQQADRNRGHDAGRGL